MTNAGSKIGNILKAVEEANGLLNEFITPEIEELMNPEQKEKLKEVRKMSKEDLKKASESIQKINLNNK